MSLQTRNLGSYRSIYTSENNSEYDEIGDKDKQSIMTLVLNDESGYLVVGSLLEDLDFINSPYILIDLGYRSGSWKSIKFFECKVLETKKDRYLKEHIIKFKSLYEV